MASFTIFLQCITTVTMMNFSKYESVYVSLLFNTSSLAFCYTRRKSRLLALASKATYIWCFVHVLHCPVMVSIAVLAAFVLRCAAFSLFQGFLPHSHSGVCILRLTSFSVKSGLMFCLQNGFSWPPVSCL